MAEAQLLLTGMAAQQRKNAQLSFEQKKEGGRADGSAADTVCNKEEGGG